MSQGATLCERLDWDSRLFGVSIARAVPSRVDLATRDAIFDWCRTENIDCLYFLADEHAETMRILEDAAFSRVDDRVTLELQPIPPASPPHADTRGAFQSDIAALRHIAAVSHYDSRFYHDRHFDRERCDELYRIWIEKSCQGWADHVVVVERHGNAIGYLTVHLSEPDAASIGLVGVDPAYRRHGIGARLMDGALAWIAGQSVTRVRSATQGRNAASQGFFQKAGFRLTGRAIWYHRWFSSSTGVAS
jgi:N-acetylglutamate synthase-like GNAT family acetyltransferase